MERKINLAFVVLLLCSNLLGYASSNFVVIGYILFTIIHCVKSKKVKLPSYFIPFLIFLGYCLISYLWSPDDRAFFIAFTRKCYFFMALMIFQFSKFKKKELKNIFLAYGVFLSLFMLFSIVSQIPNFLHNHYLKVFTYHDLVRFFENNAIYVSLYCAVTIILFLILGLFKKYWYISLCLFIFLILLSSKNLIFTTFIITFFFLVRDIRSIKKQYNWALGIGIFIFAIIAVFVLRDKLSTELQSQFQHVLNHTDFKNYIWTGSDIRLFLLKTGLLILNENHAWILGIGLGCARSFIKEVFENYNLYFDYFDYNFHNQYMQVTVEIGLIGLTLFLALLTYFFQYLKKNIDPQFVLVTILFGVAFLTESYLERQHGILFFTLIIAILLHSQSFLNKIKN